ncbi:efflux RND transporter permease subunit [Aliarcobacter thereius]|uniref:Multidrug resistance protein MexB n=2 Tax=Aliarcobacter thereius TaxID=544718 RepID=A0A1C0B409_9BACT|nr:efflux RND transporter permease subunit [Aliarcobacter thereius]OCL90080.1 Multidrug resistance protein MexB [Aliarcobacter thereius]OCL96320.1 Multidrug resistance protein MexB [Aliarcobacter thereius LMG 24486]OCL97092.1 Multidrug resistance protein MexB [Aliarcobacter thereius]QBF15717.1 RND family efflux system, inner membrane transporter, AcrB family [Aliarcobacter thereius LMG 24486]TLS92500.1 efflux RND transporter permease subunit [Aliarcobacter thereius]
MKIEKIILDILNSKRKTFLVLFTTFLLFILSVLSLPSEILKAKMLPDKDSDSFSIYVDLKDGSSIYQTKELVNCITNSLQKEENITNISAFLSQGQPIDFAGLVKQSSLKYKESQAELMINIKRFKDRDITSYNLVNKLRNEVLNSCSSEDAVIKFIQLPAGPPVLASLVAEVYGGVNFQSRRDFAQKVANVFKNQNTLVDIDILADEDYRVFSLNINNNKTIMSGVDLEHLKATLYIAFEGMSIAVVNNRYKESQIPIFLRLNNSKNLSSNSKSALNSKLSSLKIMNNKGQMISISELVSINESIKEPEISSKNMNPLINVIAETSNDSQIYPLLDSRNEIINSFNKDYDVIKTNMLNLAFVDKLNGEKFDLIFDGELKVTIDTFIDLGGAFIIALVLIFLLMVIYYKSFSLSGAIVLSSFVSIIGVIFAHIIMDIFTEDIFYLTATSLIGFIALIGINSRNSTLIIDFAKQLKNEQNLNTNEAIAKAAATRSKPIILTVLVLVFASSLIANDAVFGGLGVALIGGTLISYVVSMFFVPIVIKNSLNKY